MTEPIRIIIVDDHSLVRSGFRLLLERINGLDVIGDYSDAEQALTAISLTPPDVLITDIAMPGISGIDLVERVRNDHHPVRCIVLSMYKSAQYVRSALAAGAVGYLLKDSVDAELEIAIRAVMRGETYLSPGVANAVVGAIRETPGIRDLTKRQVQVLQQIAEGRNTKEIAMDLGVSPKTVETHRAELMRRLDIYDIAGLVRLAIREGLVGVE